METYAAVGLLTILLLVYWIFRRLKAKPKLPADLQMAFQGQVLDIPGPSDNSCDFSLEKPCAPSSDALSSGLVPPGYALEKWAYLVRYELVSAFRSADTADKGDLQSFKLEDFSPAVQGFVDKSMHKAGNLALYQDILKNIGSELADSNKIHSLIQNDQYLTLRLLSFANSPFFSPAAQINSVSNAILIIGYANLKSFIYSEMMSRLSSAGQNLPKELMLDLCEHGSLAALCTARLAPLFPKLDQGLLYTVGLVHDIGKVLLCGMSQASAEHKQAMLLNDRDLSLAEENEIFGTNHAVVGMLVARQLGLPGIIADSIKLHHCPALMDKHGLGFDDTLLECVLAVHLGDRLAHLYPPHEGEPRPVAPLYPSFQSLVELKRLLEIFTDQALFNELKKAHSYVHGHHSKPGRESEGRKPLDWI